MRRGDLVTIALAGDYGKPRPGLIVQSDALVNLPSVIVIPLTSVLRETPRLRISLKPSAMNGLLKISQIMVDKASVIPRQKIGAKIGRVDGATMSQVNQALRDLLDLMT